MDLSRAVFFFFFSNKRVNKTRAQKDGEGGEGRGERTIGARSINKQQATLVDDGSVARADCDRFNTLSPG